MPAPPAEDPRLATIAVRLRITGTVQGVFYRASAVGVGRRLGLSGTVANRRDGSVEATIAGPPDAVDAFVAWAHRGPPLATVQGVEVELVAPREVTPGSMVVGPSM